MVVVCSLSRFKQKVPAYYILPVTYYSPLTIHHSLHIMELTSLTAISAIDGRYRKQVQHLDDYFSEFALIKYRVLVEIEYLLLLAKKGFCTLSTPAAKHLNTLKDDFTLEQAQQIKDIEKITNHDVKAVEYFLKKELEKGDAAA